jgi:hypothetical protein
LSKSAIPGFDFSFGMPTGVVKPAPFKLKQTSPLRLRVAFVDPLGRVGEMKTVDVQAKP